MCVCLAATVQVQRAVKFEQARSESLALHSGCETAGRAIAAFSCYPLLALLFPCPWWQCRLLSGMLFGLSRLKCTIDGLSQRTCKCTQVRKWGGETSRWYRHPFFSYKEEWGSESGWAFVSVRGGVSQPRLLVRLPELGRWMSDRGAEKAAVRSRKVLMLLLSDRASVGCWLIGATRRAVQKPLAATLEWSVRLASGVWVRSERRRVC